MIKFLMALMFMCSCSSTTLSAKSSNTLTIEESNTVVLRGEFSPEVINPVMQEIITKANTDPSQDYYLFIQSPGGYITLGLDLIQIINGLPANVHTICKYCYSMGFQTVQGVKGIRYILPSGTLMAHKARGGFKGEFPGQIDSRLNFWKQRLKRLDKATAKRTKGKYTTKSFEDLYENEYWCEGAECVNQGLADKVVNVTCGKSLQGISRQTVRARSFFGTIRLDAELSNCPLVSGPLKVQAYLITKSGKKRRLGKIPGKLKKVLYKKLGFVSANRTIVR